MNAYWSTYVQTPEELYASRALRFREDNRELWLDTIGASDGMKILEVGCGPGLFSHRVKAALPHADVTGLDFDEAHIAFAAKKAAALGADCSFVCGDACALPFQENQCDLCFSHTVMCFCEPDRFAAEQYRVLKDGGRMTAMDVVNRGGAAERWVPSEENEEKELFDRLWAGAEKNENSRIRRYSDSKRQWAESMKKAGFRHISLRALAVVSYCPDSAEVDPALALRQINEDRLSELSSAQKARRMAPEAITPGEFSQLEEHINRRYDARIAQYERGEALWDYDTSTVIAVTGIK